ncbi:ferrochelatase [Candidatus Tenderia electrophaga]|jgi:ferrochelatase|uniref:Ferrochelatase n=1 Tax=Candidatus Tenderia electrophaga TaxID=1748243 RepID=A0A0S2TBK8_9GAMM|nr:ferrochelatase [Candidatus Tenderia electrophaga]
MSSYQGTADYDHKTMPCTGVLLCNLGSPDAPTPEAVRRYLAQFLWDPRVIEVSRPVWWLALHGVILRIRPKRSARAYQKVWTDDGSPLIAISKRQAEALQLSLESRIPGPVHVALAMRYGRPSIDSALQRLKQANARRILVLPLYPQYSATTTASVFDAVMDELKTWRWLPEMRYVNHYHDDARYIQALANSIREQFEAEGRPQKLIFSFHGTPKRYFLAGDPYFCECHKTARLTAAALGLSDEQWQLTFQSRFGREEWLQPYTDKTLGKLPKQGIKNIAVVSPAFSADCLETLEEIAMENRDIFLEAGGESYRYIPALNDRPDHIEALTELALRHMQGWPELEADWNVSHVTRAAEATQARARALGA